MLLMKIPGLSDKWLYTLYSAVVLVLIMNPYTYQLTQKVFGSLFEVANKAGCPTTAGFYLHVVVFSLIIRALMN
jgi:hypothetical protein